MLCFQFYLNKTTTGNLHVICLLLNSFSLTNSCHYFKQVLLSSTAFMSPLDSREGKNLNGVKSFSINSLSKPIAAQKWDLVKVLVSQPFNRHVQYGLTFIKFMVAPDPNEPPKIGMFGLRKPIGGGSSDEDDSVRPGSLFTSRLVSPKTNSSKASIDLFYINLLIIPEASSY